MIAPRLSHLIPEITDQMDLGVDQVFGPMKVLKQANSSDRIKPERMHFQESQKQWRAHIDEGKSQTGIDWKRGLVDIGDEDSDNILHANDFVLVKPGNFDDSNLSELGSNECRVFAEDRVFAEEEKRDMGRREATL